MEFKIVSLILDPWFDRQHHKELFDVFFLWEKVNETEIIGPIKGVWPDHFWIHPSKWSFWYQMKAPIFLITSVKYDMQQMLILKDTSENVGKVQKLL